MNTPSNRRVRKEDLEDMLTAAIPLMQLDDYAPFDSSISKDRIVSMVARVKAAREQEKLAADAYNSDRDAAVEVEHEFYRMAITARKHCVVQYGENSSVVRALGLKRRLEYKRPSRATRTEPVEEA